MATKEKNFWVLLVFVLSGLVIGGLIGELASKTGGLWWLGYAKEFGLTNPVLLDLSILKISFGFSVSINIASILGIAIALIIYRKI